jgi:hypothetical protein
LLMPGNRVHQPFLLLVPLCLILVEKMALCKMLGAVLLCRLSVGDSSPPKDTGGGDQWSVVSARKVPSGGRGSRRAEVNCQCSVVVLRRSIAARAFLTGRLLPKQSRNAAHVGTSLSHSVG